MSSTRNPAHKKQDIYFNWKLPLHQKQPPTLVCRSVDTYLPAVDRERLLGLTAVAAVGGYNAMQYLLDISECNGIRFKHHWLGSQENDIGLDGAKSGPVGVIVRSSLI